MKRRCVTIDEATPIDRQPSKPCGDCPWARAALPGWLGELSPEEWIATAHGENVIECHTLKPTGGLLLRVECAGAAIYRANVCKLVHTVPGLPTPLKLPADRERVFARPAEFIAHHKRGPGR